jgi:hypothetical protein
MAEVTHLTQETQTIPFPQAVTATQLAGTNVEVLTDGALLPDKAILELQPPEMFDAQLAGGTLHVVARPDYFGGQIRLRTGAGKTTKDWNIDGRGGDILVSGSKELPLYVGTRAVATGGNGTIFAEQVRANKISFTHRLGKDRITPGQGLIVPDKYGGTAVITPAP